MTIRLRQVLFFVSFFTIGFISWVYVYNAEFGIFIVPEDSSTRVDNFVRISQLVTGSILGFVGLDIENDTR